MENHYNYNPTTSQHDGQLLDKIAHRQLDDIKDFLASSEQEIKRRDRFRKAFIVSICSLCVLSVGAFLWALIERNAALNLQEQIKITAKSNMIATKAYMNLDKDPTLAFRLAEQAYNIDKTPLARQVMMAAYGEMPFYVKLNGHTAPVTQARFTPDGKLIITTGYDDHTIRIWNLKGQVLSILEGHSGILAHGNDGTLNISSDGKYILSASSDSTARLWEITGKCITMMKHEGPVSSACFSPQPSNNQSHQYARTLLRGKKIKNNQLKILTASSDKTARLWDMEGNELVRFEGHKVGLKFALFSPEGKNIVTISGNTPRLWNKNGTLIKKLRSHKAAIFHCSFSKKGNYFITCSWDKTAFVWNDKGEFVAKLIGHKALVSIADFTPDEKFIITGSADGDIKIWDIEGKNISSLNNHTAFVWGVKTSNNGKYIISNSDDGTARLWDLKGTELMVLKGHTSQVMSANFSPDGNYVVTGSGDNTARIWNIQPKENPILRGHTAYVVDANFSPDGQYIVTAGWDYRAKLWSKSGEHLRDLTGFLHYGLDYADFNKNGDLIAIGCNQQVKIFDLQGDSVLEVRGHEGNVTRLQFIKNKKLFITYSNDKLSILWNFEGEKLHIIDNVDFAEFSYEKNILIVTTPDSTLTFFRYIEEDSIYFKEYHTIKIPGTAFTAVDFSPNNKYFLTTSEDSAARLWDFQAVISSKEKQAQPIYTFKHPTIVSSPVFSHDNLHFLTIANDNIVRIWKIGGKKVSELKGHSDNISYASFSHNGKLIATGSLDRTARIWDLEGNELVVYTGFGDEVGKVHFSPDDKYLLMSSYDHTARLMPITVEDVLKKINVEKVRGNIFELSDEDKEIYGIK